MIKNIDRMHPRNGRYLRDDDSVVNVTDMVETSARGDKAWAVYVQDQTTNLLSVPFLIERSTATLAQDTVVNSRTVELSPGHSAVVGQIMELAEVQQESAFLQSQIIAVNVNTITLDHPVNRVYSAATAVVVMSSNQLNVDGSVNPQVFSVLPLANQSGDMVRVVFEIRDDLDMDFTTFGGLPALTNGCVLRINHGNGTYRNIFNFKSNGDLLEQAFDGLFLQPKQGGTIKGFVAKLSWGGQGNHGVAVRLDGSLDEALEVVIQDDLTGLARFNMTAQGHELQVTG